MRRAFFMAQSEDVESSIVWSDYSFIVCNPDMPEGKIERLRALSGGAVLLAYDNCMDSPHDDWDSIYWKRKKELIKPFQISKCWYDDCKGFILEEILAQRLARFHSGTTVLKGFDGLYLDRCPKFFPANQIDGNEEYASIWPYLRQHYTAMLRRFLPNRLLIANSSGPMADPMLNGISLEYIESKIPLIKALGMFTCAIDVAWRFKSEYEKYDPFCIGWVRTPQEQEAVETLRGIPWMVYGEMKGLTP